VAGSDELKCSETNWKMESENIMKTHLKSNMDIAEMSLNQVVKILDKQLDNDYYVLFTKASTLGSAAAVLHS
jgi:hypothetical protein